VIFIGFSELALRLKFKKISKVAEISDLKSIVEAYNKKWGTPEYLLRSSSVFGEKFLRLLEEAGVWYAGGAFIKSPPPHRIRLRRVRVSETFVGQYSFALHISLFVQHVLHQE